jgi:hypothetical protein
MARSSHDSFEPVLALGPIGQDTVQKLKEFWTVVRHRDVAELVRDDVVNRVHERWFCSEREAQAAGWRKAAR